MPLRELIAKNRTRRRFYQKERINVAMLKDLVDLARLSPNGGNIQPLKYMISNEQKKNALVFECLAWAGYLNDWDGPAEGERPSAYIVVLGDTELSKSFEYDAGIAAQSIMLGATEQGLGGCIFGSILKQRLRENLKLPVRYEILLVLGLGKPRETVVIDRVKDNNIKYWRAENGVHHVPKRAIKEILLPWLD